MPRYLLDTHTLLWALTSPSTLRESARDSISDPNNEVYVSAVSGWEIALKSNLGKLQVPDNVFEMIEVTGFAHLSVSFSHGVEAGSLPLHHRDPFDRLLVAQARTEDLVLVTRDNHMIQYNVELLPA